MNGNQAMSVLGQNMRRIGMLCAMVAILPACGIARAGVVLQPGTTIEFATFQQGRAVLGTRDDFIQMMSQFDRCVRMKTSAAVTEAQFLAYIQSQVVAWSAADQVLLSNIVVALRPLLTNLNLSLPPIIQVIKTTGNEEGNSAYVRGTSIIFPQVMVSSGSSAFTRYLTHELFHVYTYHNPQMREALYGVLGVRLCNEIPFPPWLLARRIASPNPTPWDFEIRVKAGGERIPVMPMFYYTSTNYTNGSLFDYLGSKLLVLEEAPAGLGATLSDTGEPILLDSWSVGDYFNQIGNNTGYIIHPEETLADNFMQMVLRTNSVSSPRVHHLLRRVLQSGSSMSPRLLAGRFTGSLFVESSHPLLLETSTDLIEWQILDAFTNTTGSLEVYDPTAWLGGNRFFRAKAVELPPLQAGDTNNLVWVPPGTFLMGSPNSEAGRQSIEGPQRRVTLTRGFWMGKFEVTQGEYQQVMGTNPSSFAGVWSRPVESVSWAEATNYCAQLTQQEQTEGRLPDGYAYRLPTEAEWEYAARAGTTNRYSFGDDPDYLECYERLWFIDNANSQPHPVGLTPANAWGLHDMHGNILEWCKDWYGTYSAGAVTDPQGPATGTSRIMRGGGWGYGPHNCRSAARNSMSPNSRYYGTGFRIVLAPTGM
jgi:formylglycine-generating enzyme required for sulfatase activity